MHSTLASSWSFSSVVPGSSYQLRFLTIVCLSEIFISLFVSIGPEILGSGQLEQF